MITWMLKNLVQWVVLVRLMCERVSGERLDVESVESAVQ